MNNPDDRRTAAAEAKAAKARAKAMRPWYTKKRFIALGVFAVIIVIGALGSGGDSDGGGDDVVATETPDPGTDAPTTDVGTSSGNTEFPPPADVTLTSCEVDTSFAATVTAKLQILNNSPKRSNYMITVAFESPDGTQLDTGTGFANDVDPSQQALSEAMAFFDADPGAISCRIKEVERFAS